MTKEHGVLLLSQVEMQEDGTVVGWMPEVGDVLRVADRSCIAVADDRNIADTFLQRWSGIEEIDARLATGSADELVGIGLVDKVDIRCLTKDIVVNEEASGVLGELIRSIVYA